VSTVRWVTEYLAGNIQEPQRDISSGSHETEPLATTCGSSSTRTTVRLPFSIVAGVWLTVESLLGSFPAAVLSATR
jgi:hypothetical protein